MKQIIIDLLKTGSYSKIDLSRIAAAKMSRKQPFSIAVIESTIRELRNECKVEQDGNLFTIIG